MDRKSDGPKALSPSAASDLYALETVNLSKSINNTQVLDRVCLRLPKGQIYNLIGLDHSGKTTLLRILAGLSQPDEGKIYFNGENSKESTALARKATGLRFEAGFYSYLTARQNLIYIAELRGIRHAKKEAARVPELLNFEKADVRCAELSRSALQELGICAAFLGHPELLLLDEPMIGMQLSTVEAARKALQTLRETEGLTVLITSNLYLNIGMQVDRVGFMDEGRLIHEMSSVKLRQACRSELILKVDRTEKAAWVLEQVLHCSDYDIDAEKQIHLRAFVDRPEAVSEALTREGIRIDLIYPSEIGLQDYFFKIRGDSRLV